VAGASVSEKFDSWNASRLLGKHSNSRISSLRQIGEIKWKL